eukprot:4556892-Amphidinium_carterae.1
MESSMMFDEQGRGWTPLQCVHPLLAVAGEELDALTSVSAVAISPKWLACEFVAATGLGAVTKASIGSCAVDAIPGVSTGEKSSIGLSASGKCLSGRFCRVLVRLR